jgi:hypothetical protein
MPLTSAPALSQSAPPTPAPENASGDKPSSQAARNPTASLPATFGQIELPEAWKTQFWESEPVKALFKLEPKKIADMVPVQVGVRFCRCPACDADELDDPLTWTPEKPDVVTCRRCQAILPNDKFPAKVNNAIPEETIEVLPGVVHHYPYHTIDPLKQHYPDEQAFIQGRRDDLCRQFLAKAALYAATRYQEQPQNERDPKLALTAAVLILRFAQVYPAYSVHFDQPRQPKLFQPANLPPPYRRHYQTGKWEWDGSQGVPLNLLWAYTLLRDDPAIEEAGKLLGDPRPRRTIERDLFRTSAEFVRNQTDEHTEAALHVYRGLFAVGTVLEDEELIRDAMVGLAEFSRLGFYHDGFWRGGGARSHQRIVGMLDGWFGAILAPGLEQRTSEVTRTMARPGPDSSRRRGESVSPSRELGTEIPVLALSKEAVSTIFGPPDDPGVRLVSWPNRDAPQSRRRPLLLGGAGLARLAVGDGPDALDLEIHAPDSLASPHFQRLALRLAVSGRPVLDDLDELPATTSGWDLATASHNAVVVDGLNQRESAEAAREPAPGADLVFFAADPDFQVASFDDPHAYPQSTTRYRHTLMALATDHARYAVSVFEVNGGLQHDQIFHSAPGLRSDWVPMNRLGRAPGSLLPPALTFLKNATAEQGRWFVQAYGEFDPLGRATIDRPTQVALLPSRSMSGAERRASAPSLSGVPESTPDEPGVRLHLLGDVPIDLIKATSLDPTGALRASKNPEDTERASLILRHRSTQGSTLNSTFVTVFEPVGPHRPPLRRVGRVASPAGTVLLLVETVDGPEHVLLNAMPGVEQRLTLSDGRLLVTDGLAVRERGGQITLAGGTFAELDGGRVEHERPVGSIIGAKREPWAQGLGWFETMQPIGNGPSLRGRYLRIRHGDQMSHAWTITDVVSTARQTRIYVREEPGFTIDEENQTAEYYQFPRLALPAPHEFEISVVSRGVPAGPPGGRLSEKAPGVRRSEKRSRIRK